MAAISKHQLGPAFVPLVALAVAVLGFGLTPIFVRLSEVGPVATAFYRTAIAVPILLLWLGARHADGIVVGSQPSRRDYAWLVFSSLFFANILAVGQTTFVITSVANATLLGNMTPVFVVIGGWLIYGERITLLFLFGLGVSMAAASVLVSGGRLEISAVSFGDGLALFQALNYGTYILLLKRVRRAFSSAMIVTWNAVVVAAALLPMAALLGEPLVPLTLAGWVVLFAIALVCHVGAQSCLTYSLAHVSASLSAVGMLGIPVISAAIAWAVLAEPMSVIQIIAGAAVLVGVAIAQHAQARET